MRNPGGYAVVYDPDLPTLWERDTFTCKHCNRVVFVPLKSDNPDGTVINKPRRGFEEHGYCLQCDALICCDCAGRGVCDPFERKLERMEGRAILRRSMEE